MGDALVRREWLGQAHDGGGACPRDDVAPAEERQDPAIGEWSYYVLGSPIEVAMLAGIAHYAWTWPRTGAGSPVDGQGA